MWDAFVHMRSTKTGTCSCKEYQCCFLDCTIEPKTKETCPRPTEGFNYFQQLLQAALFNQTEIAFVLMDHGANVQSKNGQGETPLDCTPAMLQYKMRQKMEELVTSQGSK